jgi:hypothetical protein
VPISNYLIAWHLAKTIWVCKKEFFFAILACSGLGSEPNPHWHDQLTSLSMAPVRCFRSLRNLKPQTSNLNSELRILDPRSTARTRRAGC